MQVLAYCSHLATCWLSLVSYGPRQPAGRLTVDRHPTYHSQTAGCWPPLVVVVVSVRVVGRAVLCCVVLCFHD